LIVSKIIWRRVELVILEVVATKSIVSSVSIISIEVSFNFGGWEISIWLGSLRTHAPTVTVAPVVESPAALVKWFLVLIIPAEVVVSILSVFSKVAVAVVLFPLIVEIVFIFTVVVASETVSLLEIAIESVILLLSGTIVPGMAILTALVRSLVVAFHRGGNRLGRLVLVEVVRGVGVVSVASEIRIGIGIGGVVGSFGECVALGRVVVASAQLAPVHVLPLGVIGLAGVVHELFLTLQVLAELLAGASAVDVADGGLLFVVHTSALTLFLSIQHFEFLFC